MSSSSSSVSPAATAAFSQLADHLQQQQLPPPVAPASEQLCYVHCNFCDTVLVVSVPSSSLFKTVTVRCGHCSSLLTVNMRGLLFPATAAAHHNQLHFGHSPNLVSPNPSHHSLLDEISCTNPNLLLEQPNLTSLITSHNTTPAAAAAASAVKGAQEPSPRTNPVVNRPPEKRQRVPSAYNRFIKDEIQRIKAGNPDISHREAFSAAAKNWAHFPHIHFGLMPDHHQNLKKTSLIPQDHHQRKDALLKDGLYAAAAAAAAANMGVAPY